MTKFLRHEPEALPKTLYDEHYYDKILPGREHLDNPDLIDEAAPDTIRIGNIRPGARVLDFGCGRGALAVALAKYGCNVTGADYSLHAVRFANELKKSFPEAVREKVHFEQLSARELAFHHEFDVIVFNQVYEHLYNWELKTVLAKFRQALKPDGILV